MTAGSGGWSQEQGSCLSLTVALSVGLALTVCHPRPEHTRKGTDSSGWALMGRELPEPFSLLSEPQLSRLLNGDSCLSQDFHKDHRR